MGAVKLGYHDYGGSRVFGMRVLCHKSPDGVTDCVERPYSLSRHFYCLIKTKLLVNVHHIPCPSTSLYYEEVQRVEIIA
jgi:hypothetical protein